MYDSKYFETNEESDKRDETGHASIIILPLRSLLVSPSHVTAVQLVRHHPRSTLAWEYDVGFTRTGASPSIFRSPRWYIHGTAWTRPAPCLSFYSSRTGVDRCACLRTRRDAVQTLLERVQVKQLFINITKRRY